MRWVRYESSGREFSGVLEDGSIREGNGSPLGDWRENGHRLGIDEVELRPPVVPGKIVAVGLNYRDHAAEMAKPLPEEPMLFLKPPSALSRPEGTILLPPQSREVHFEGELAVVIGHRARHVTETDASAHVLGYTCMIDVTARDLQRKDVQYTRAKGFDTFAPLGPWIETELDPSDVAIRTVVNGEVRQSSRTRELIFSVPRLVSFVSSVMTLEPGDVISTGTPSGVGEIHPGDVVELTVEGVGTLRCGVAAA